MLHATSVVIGKNLGQNHVEDKYKINDNFASRTVWDNRVSCLHDYK